MGTSSSSPHLTQAVVVLLTATIFAGAACASDPAVIESADASTVVPSSETVTPTTEVDQTTETTSSPTTSAASSSTSTTSSSTTTVPPTTTTVTGSITPLGDFLLVEGEFVKISDTVDPEAECTSGSLAVRSGGEIRHVYEELGTVLALELIEGFYGQSLLVETCEESLIRLIFTSTAMVPEDGVPELTVATIPASVFDLGDYWWGRDGWFHADAVFHDGGGGWNDHVVFDSFDGSMQLFADTFGERIRLDNGIDFVLPHRWEIADGDPALDMIELVDTESPAAMSITVFPGPVPDPEARGDEELLNTFDRWVDHWEEIGGGRSRTTGDGRSVTDHWFSGAEGVRQVRTVDLEDRTVRIVAHTPSSAGAVDELVPDLALQQVRIYTAVG